LFQPKDAFRFELLARATPSFDSPFSFLTLFLNKVMAHNAGIGWICFCHQPFIV